MCHYALRGMSQQRTLPADEVRTLITPSAEAQRREGRFLWWFTGLVVLFALVHVLLIRPVLPADLQAPPLATVVFVLVLFGIGVGIELHSRSADKRSKFEVDTRGIVRNRLFGPKITAWADVDHAELVGDRWPYALLVLDAAGKQVAYLHTDLASHRAVAFEVINRVSVVPYVAR